MTDVELQICTCQRRTDAVYQYGTVMWSDLCERLKSTKRTAETLAEYKKKPKADQDAIKDVGGYVLGDLADGKRSTRTVRSRSAITLDLDFAPMNFWSRFSLMFDNAACCYSTHKHQPSSPKFRVIIPLTRPVSPDEYEAIARWIASSDGMEIDWCDDTTFQPSRMMFWPSTSTDGEYFFEVQDGEILDPQSVLDLYGDYWNDISRWTYSSRVLEKRKKEAASKQKDPLEKKGAVGSFCRTYTIQEAIEAYLPDVYTPTDKPNRWTYTNGTSSGGLVIYDQDTLAYSNHASDPAGQMHCVNAFDLVRIHKFGSLDEQKTANQVGVNLPSYKAMCELVSEDKLVQKTVAAEMFSRQVEKMAADETGVSAEQFAKDNADWQCLLLRHPKTGKLEETIENVCVILENDTKLKGLGAYNEFQDFAEKSETLPWWKFNPFSKEWSDADTTELILYLEKYYGLRTERIIKHGRDILHMRRAFHPVRDWLDALPEWDGIERLDTLLVDYMSAEDTAYTRAVTRKAVVAAVKRIYEPGCKMDYTLTLAGKQGLRKSSFFRTLVPDPSWFSDSLDTFQGKESYEALQGSWIIEIAELSAAKRSDIERTKQFLTKQDDKLRKAYAEKTGRYRRQCIFVATTNSSDFLRDMSGNRRWWVVPVWGRGTKDVFEDLPKERDQIFAEAKARYKAGEKLYLPDELEAKAAEMQEEYTYRSIKYEQIEEFLDLDLPDGREAWPLEQRQTWLIKRDHVGTHKRDKVCLLEIWQEVFGGNRVNINNMDQREISDILMKIGWERSKGKRRFGAIYGLQRAFVRPKNRTQ